MIITDEVSSIDSKDESRNDVERDSNIHNKSRTKIIIHQEDTSAIDDIGTVLQSCIEEYFGSANNQTTNMLSSARDYVEKKLQNIIFSNDNDVYFKEGIKIWKLIRSTLRKLEEYEKRKCWKRRN